MSATGIEELKTYYLHRQNTISHNITTQPILEMCLAEEQKMGIRVVRQ